MRKNNSDNTALKKQSSGTGQTEVTYEHTLSDYYPDIKRVLHVFPTVRTTGAYASDGRAEYDGCINCGVLYRGEDKTLRYAELKKELHGNITVGEMNEGACDVSLDNESITVRATDPRRLALKARIKGKADVVTEENTYPVYKGEDVKEENIQKKECEIKTSDITVCGENGIGMSEDIVIPDTAPEAKRIVLVSLVPLISEIHVENGKAHVRTEVRGFAVYETQSDDSTPSAFAIPISLMLSHIVSCPEITENSVCVGKTDIYDITAEISEDTKGEKRIIELDLLYDVKITCRNEGVLTALSDVYCVSYGCDVRRKEIITKSNVCTVKGNFSINSGIPEDISQKIEGDVLFASGNTENYSITVCNGKLICEGTLEITVVFCTDEYESVRYPISFKGELDSPFKSANDVCAACCRCGEVKIRCDGESWYADAEIYVDAMVCEKNSCSIVDEATFKSDSKEIPSSSFTMYYPSCGETLWDVAKKYGVFVSDVQRANGTQRKDGDKKVIMIPKLKKNRP